MSNISQHLLSKKCSYPDYLTMTQLIIISFIWAFSFSLIGNYISGQVDIYIAIFIRFALAALVLLPFFDFDLLKRRISFKLVIIGAIQIGLMYIAYFKSFQYLSVPEVALFTVFTPLFISTIDNILKRKFTFGFVLTSVLAVLGAVIIRWGNVSHGFFIGFILVQGANICFAAGQVLYKHLMAADKLNNIKDKNIFFLFYIGALLPIIPMLVIKSNFSMLPSTTIQYGVLLWLGVVASGAGYLFWNSGARKVNSGLLAVMNNAVIPLAIIVNIVLWKASVDLRQFVLGSTVIVLSLYLNQKFYAKKY